MQRFFLLARQMRARFTLTADAHHPDDFARLDLALEWARQAGFGDECFLTAQELLERQGKKASREPEERRAPRPPDLGGQGVK
jgi:hypothetical protein